MFSPREAQKDFLYTKMAVLVLSLLVSGGIAIWGFQQGVEYGLIAFSPERSAGRIVKVEEKPDTIKVTFAFEDRRLVKYQGGLLQRRQFALPLKTGDDVDVLYFSHFPSVAQLELQLSKQAISFYILLGCFLVHILTATLIVRTVGQIKRHTAEDFYY